MAVVLINDIIVHCTSCGIHVVPLRGLIFLARNRPAPYARRPQPPHPATPFNTKVRTALQSYIPSPRLHRYIPVIGPQNPPHLCNITDTWIVIFIMQLASLFSLRMRAWNLHLARTKHYASVRNRTANICISPATARFVILRIPAGP